MMRARLGRVLRLASVLWSILALAMALLLWRRFAQEGAFEIGRNTWTTEFVVLGAALLSLLLAWLISKRHSWSASLLWLVASALWSALVITKAVFVLA